MSHPLMSWDIVTEGRQRRREFADDLKAIALIGERNEWDVAIQHRLDNCIIWENKTVIITNATLRIEWATKNILSMNGYTPAEVVGHTPRIFQGSATTEEEKKPIREAILHLQPFNNIITNYRKNGSIYRCRIEGFPVFNRGGMLVNFIAQESIYYERGTNK